MLQWLLLTISDRWRWELILLSTLLPNISVVIMICATPGPFTSFLLERGLKTFALRMEHHNRAGLVIARMLESHPKIEKIWYPGLESHPDHQIAIQQMNGFGSVITFLLKGGDKETRKFIDSLELFLI